MKKSFVPDCAPGRIGWFNGPSVCINKPTEGTLVY